MNKLKAVIVDDEPDSISLLQLQLERHCPSISSITTFSNPVKALELIPAILPDLLFVDIEMPTINGFELLEQLSPFYFKVIFITAYSQYAIRAFRFNALDYILKPADTETLQQAVNKTGKQYLPVKEQLSLANQIMNEHAATRIALPSQNGVTFINLNDIVYAEASNNYTKFFLFDNSTHLLSKTLKDVQELLEESHFHRVHRQYLVNLNCVKHFNRNEGILMLDTKKELPIVRNQYEKFMEKYYHF